MVPESATLSFTSETPVRGSGTGLSTEVDGVDPNQYNVVDAAFACTFVWWQLTVGQKDWPREQCGLRSETPVHGHGPPIAADIQ